jgi:hypothetical protein
LLNDRYAQQIEGSTQSVELSADDLEILAAYSTQGLDPHLDQVQDQQEAERIDGDAL